MAADPHDWRDRANCRGIDPDLFYPSNHATGRDVHLALSYCQPCPVRTDCLEHAIEHRERGIWGATTHRQRVQIRRQRRQGTPTP